MKTSATTPEKLSSSTPAWTGFYIAYAVVALLVVCFAHQITGTAAAEDPPSWLQIGLTVLLGGTAWVISTVRALLDFHHNSRICFATTVMVDNGRGSNSPSMVLFDMTASDATTLDEFDAEITPLLEVSREIFSLYKTAPNYDTEDINDFVKHLNNDTYQDGARFRVPESMSRGRQLYVADILISQSKLHPDSQFSGLAVVAITGDHTGRIVQLPWHEHPNAEAVFLQPELEPVA